MLSRVTTTYRGNARTKKLPYTLAREQMGVLISGECHYCGRPPSQVFHNKATGETAVYNGVDRANDGKGYTPDNVVSCCKECNFRKGATDSAEFLAWVHRVAARTQISTEFHREPGT